MTDTDETKALAIAPSDLSSSPSEHLRVEEVLNTNQINYVKIKKEVINKAAAVEANIPNFVVQSRKLKQEFENKELLVNTGSKEINPEATATLSETIPNFVVQSRNQKQESHQKTFKTPSSKVSPKSRTTNLNKNKFVDVSQSKLNSLKRKKFFRDESLDLQCEWDDCCDTADRMEDFMRHVATHVREAEVKHNPPPLMDVFACLWAVCGFETCNSEEMVRHINFHSFHTKIKCHGRNMLVTNNVLPCNLDSSQRNILPDLAQPFLCLWDGCDYSDENWEHPQNFYWHVKNHPEDIRGMVVQCRWEGCVKVDSAVSKLKEHMRCHSQERLIGCPTCGGLFANRVKFFDHCKKQQVHEHTFVCTNCGKTFAIERHLRDHMRSHINHYKCTHCDMTCPTPSTLNNHIIYRHTTEKPYPCEFCKYRGKTPADVKSHLRVHYKEVEIACDKEGCGFTCRAKITMKQHKLLHTENSLLYACHLCEKRFNRGNYLTKHLTQTHSFSCPSGHSRFRYITDTSTGLYRLQTVRFESVELLQGGAGYGLDYLAVNKNSDCELELDQTAASEDTYQERSSSDQCGPLSVQSCPELGGSLEQYHDLCPWSLQDVASGEYEQMEHEAFKEDVEDEKITFEEKFKIFLENQNS